MLFYTTKITTDMAKVQHIPNVPVIFLQNTDFSTKCYKKTGI